MSTYLFNPLIKYNITSEGNDFLVHYCMKQLTKLPHLPKGKKKVVLRISALQEVIFVSEGRKSGYFLLHSTDVTNEDFVKSASFTYR